MCLMKLIIEMADIVVLSDSNESVLSLDEQLTDKKQKVEEQNVKKPLFDATDLDFEFPEVNFYHIIDEDEKLLNIENKNSLSNFNSRASKSPTTSTTSKRHETDKSLHKISNLPNFSENSDDENINIQTQKKSKTVVKKNKSQLTKERLKRQEQLMRERALRIIASKKSKNIKPGECMKFIEVIFDKSLETFASISDIVNTLIETNLQYSINTELVPNSITWKRNIENNYINEVNEICTLHDVQTLNHILIVWNWDETVTKVANGNFCASISDIRTVLPDYIIILVIFGIEDYFMYRKCGRNSIKHITKTKTQKTNSKNPDVFKNYPEISWKQLESHLNEVQITAGCSSKLINTTKDLALMVYQCTKAIAEIPYKLEKNQNLTSKFDWYVMGDNRNTVKVDKLGNGLKRLWQQQLCQFSLSSLEIAEAICAVYPSPADLIEAYMNCTVDEGRNLLKDIPIRRAAGPLTAIRKIGQELSKKIYLMFMSKNGENLLG